MSSGRGCLKNGCFGCLGLFVLLVVFLGANALIVMSHSGDEQIADKMISSESALATVPITKSSAAPADDEKPSAGQGWLILELGQGEFQLHPGEAGAGVVIKANYDQSTYELQEYHHTWADSAWVYHVRFRRTISGLQAALREVMGGNHAARLHIYIPPDLPLELNLLVKEGGLEAELGGLWLTDVDLRYNKGGIALSIDEPLREPVKGLTIHGQMGGVEIVGVGNASPQRLDVSCRMGGASLDLSGAWLNDCDARLKVFMGGMDVSVPDNIEWDQADTGLESTDVEIGRPVLRVQQDMKMGEIEIR